MKAIKVHNVRSKSSKTSNVINRGKSLYSTFTEDTRGTLNFDGAKSRNLS